MHFGTTSYLYLGVDPSAPDISLSRVRDSQVIQGFLLRRHSPVWLTRNRCGNILPKAKQNKNPHL